MADTKQKITVEDLCRITLVEDPRISPDGAWVAHVQVTVDRLDNGYKRNIWLTRLADGKTLQLTRSGKDTQPRWSPDGQTLAFVSARDDKSQVYLLPITEPGGEARALTALPNGATSPAWSPDGHWMAFLSPMNATERAKEDRREEDHKPADKLDAKQRKERRDQDESQRWDPRPAWRIPYRSGTSFLSDRFNQIYVMPTTEGLDKDQSRPRRLTSADADHEAPQWTPDGQFILTARIGNPQGDEPWRWSNLYRVRVADGSHEQLTDETFSSFNPTASPDGRWIAFVRLPRERLSERMSRLAVMPSAGGEIRDLNLAFDRAVYQYKWSPDGSSLYFTCANAGRLELYRVDPDTGTFSAAASGEIHIETFDVHPQAGLVMNVSTPANPSELYHQPASEPHARPITQINQKFLDSLIVQPIHELRWKTTDGAEIQGWYLLPVDYEAGKTYPLALNIHGGPHIMWGPAMKSMWHEWQLHAARGYVAFFTNPRGSDGYGEAFQMALHSQWGTLATGDILSGVDALLERGFVDPQRIAVTGGSYGGYMTTWLIAHSDRFVAAVAQRGVYNLLSFSGTTDIVSFVQSEFGMDPWEDPMFLWESSPLAHAHKIKTPLLLIHGENDFRVPIAESEQMFTYVRRNGGTVRLLRFPREGHEMTRTGEPEHRIATLTHMLEWFDRSCYPQTDSVDSKE
ncbi:MAG: S9 family peptidase [Anaerolineae bacterium]|nr:S9 family peptidase [Anaerolineae bacterium]